MPGYGGLRGSRNMMMGGSPSHFDDARSGAIGFQEFTTSSDEEEDYGQEDFDSDESDENLILLNEIRVMMGKMQKKIEKVDRAVKHSREEQRNMHIELQNLAMAQNQLHGYYANMANTMQSQHTRLTHATDYTPNRSQQSHIEEQEHEDDDEEDENGERRRRDHMRNPEGGEEDGEEEGQDGYGGGNGSQDDNQMYEDDNSQGDNDDHRQRQYEDGHIRYQEGGQEDGEDEEDEEEQRMAGIAHNDDENSSMA